MPVFMGLERLDEAGACLGSCGPLSVESPSCFEHAIHAGGADSHHIIVEHHEGQSAIPFEWMPVMEVDDGGLLPVLEPVVAGDVSVVLVDLAVAVFPRVILARPEFEPGEKLLRRRLGTVGPIADVVDDLIARVMGNPHSV